MKGRKILYSNCHMCYIQGIKASTRLSQVKASVRKMEKAMIKKLNLTDIQGHKMSKQLTKDQIKQNKEFDAIWDKKWTQYTDHVMNSGKTRKQFQI